MYYILYEEYTEYNQFEGSYDKTWKFFNTKKEAINFLGQLTSDVCSNYRNIIGPLKIC